MKFWDASALVPLTVEEPSSQAVKSLVGEDPQIVAWWSSPIECTSAIARRERSGAMDPDEAEGSRLRLIKLAETWTEIPPGNRLRDVAVRLIRVHDLRAGDALQLAAALAASESRPATLDLVTLDDRLALAARREGFHVLPSASAG